MFRLTAGGILVSCVILQTGCGTLVSSRQSDGEAATYSMGDVPSARHAPRTLESLTQTPRRASEAATIPASQSTVDEVKPAGRLGVDEVRLTNSGVTIDGIEPTDTPPSAEEAAQLPLILERPPQAPPAGESASDTDANRTDETPDVLSQTIVTVDDATSPSAAADASESKVVKEDPPLETMKIVVQPPADRSKEIPPALNELFENTKFAPPVDAPPVSAQPVKTPSQPDDRSEEKAQAADGQQVAYLQDVDLPVSQTLSDVEAPAVTDEAVEATGDPPTPSRNQPKQLTWTDQLEQTLHLLKQQLDDETNVTTRQQIQFQILQVLNGSFDGEQRWEWANTSPETAQYWNNQLRALHTMLNENRDTSVEISSADRIRNATQASSQLRQATDALANLASLRIDHAAFCSEVKGFGQYTSIPTSFVPGQQVLIYCEIDNYALKRQAVSSPAPSTIRQTATPRDSFTAELQGHYSIISTDNRVVSQHRYQPVRDTAQRRRRDFYMYFPVTIPDVPSGEYRLQLTVDDVIGDKVASCPQPLTFRVVHRGPAAPTAKTTGRMVPGTQYRR